MKGGRGLLLAAVSVAQRRSERGGGSCRVSAKAEVKREGGKSGRG